MNWPNSSTAWPGPDVVDAGVITIDTEFGRARLDASHLIVDEGRAAFVDTGTYFSVPKLLAALAAARLEADAVDYILLTHIHLDHAGGAGHLAKALPRARILVHPRGVAHLIDPRRLVAAAKEVYGAEKFRADYGDIAGIAAERIDATEDGAHVMLGHRRLEFLHTPGHALHHQCVIDRDAATVFTGDTFGVSYRELDTDAGEFIFPTTSPSQFDPVQLHASIDRILECRPKNLYLTHYSRVGDADRLGLDLHADIDAFVGMARAVAGAASRVKRLREQVFQHLSARLDAHGFRGGSTERHAVLDGDVTLNAAGLDAWLSRRAA